MIRHAFLALMFGCGTSPAPSVDGGVDGGVDAAKNDASSGASIAWFCNNVPVADCTECGTRTNPPETHPCVDCSDAGFVGHCTRPGVSCGIVGGYACPCANNDPSACPASYQVCVNGVSTCETCGDLATGGELCQGGGTCNADAGVCQ